jgi:hypothetical protein
MNVTQQELAARLGKPQSFVPEYERGQRGVDVVELLVNRGRSVSIHSTSSVRSRGQPGRSVRSRRRYPLTTRPRTCLPRATRIPCTKSILEPSDGHFDTPDHNNRSRAYAVKSPPVNQGSGRFRSAGSTLLNSRSWFSYAARAQRSRMSSAVI